MSRDRINAMCAGFPGARLAVRRGDYDENWKIGGQMFASVASVTPVVAVKTDSVETAQKLIAAKAALRASHFNANWVLLPFRTDEKELRRWLTQSYRLVRAGLPEELRETLPDFPDD